MSKHNIKLQKIATSSLLSDHCDGHASIGREYGISVIVHKNCDYHGITIHWFLFTTMSSNSGYSGGIALLCNRISIHCYFPSTIDNTGSQSIM